MAVPVIRGKKTDQEKFAGAEASFCIEAMMQDGKALQAGTSHDLGQNFGKAFNVTFQTPGGTREHVWQTSWGMTTRLVGAMVMTHGDDDGLVIPPKLAPIHVAIVPIYKKDDEKVRVTEVAHKIAADLRDDGLTVKVDDRDGIKPGAKYYEWERKGVPVRIEVGPRDLEQSSVMLKRRIAGTTPDGKAIKETFGMKDLGLSIGRVLDEFQVFLFERAKKMRDANTVTIDAWQDFEAVFADEGSKFVWAHWDGTTETELAIKEATKATIRCIPLAGQNPAPEAGKCVKTGKPSKQRVLFSKNY
jgi:prolyl-tRNA synthetase